MLMMTYRFGGKEWEKDQPRIIMERDVEMYDEKEDSKDHDKQIKIFLGMKIKRR